MPVKVIIIATEFLFFGINMFWALLRDHFDPRLPARPKISLGGAQDLFKPTNTNSIVSSVKSTN